MPPSRRHDGTDGGVNCVKPAYRSDQLLPLLGGLEHRRFDRGVFLLQKPIQVLVAVPERRI
jgi:hypothetical protein